MKNDYSQLLIDVQKKSNITISAIKDVKFLKEEIELVTSNKISFNTLRRLFGFMTKTNPSKQTLDILTNYLGFNSYSNYLNKKSNYDEWYFQQNLLQIKKRNTIRESELQQIKTGLQYEQSVVFYAYLVSYFIEKNKISTLIKLFSNIDLSIISGTQLQKFNAIISTSLSVIPENKALKVYAALIQYDDFRNNIPLLNIDYSGLHANYYKILELIEQNNANSSDVFFVSLMKMYKAFYIDATTEQLPDLTKPKGFDQFFEVLKGRYYACSIMYNPHLIHKTKKEIVLECTKNKVSLFLQEIIPTLIICNEFSFLKKILDLHYEEVFEHYVWSSSTTFSINLIGMANVNWYSKNTQMAKRNLELVELENIEMGYSDYISMFYYLISLRISYSENNKVDNSKSLKALQKLINKTKFIRFEEQARGYILN